ncbi:Mini-chromosome maintenance complex-binding protein [Collichthys lucidus]|uniref:Mini-chromosome maintenance complex-binding protein n=1 Tax=Collichthys lucidus TaxID=240159 RepID=A0A4U5VCK8_COLLU|nr:Mini-chromosome maintenance complex-binding protein [Collichthys lucidus]
MTTTFFLVQVPSLNDVPLHYLKPNSLVKFRCFIQDMFDPEFFMGVYASTSQARVVPSTSYAPTRQKRSYEEDDDDMDTQPQKQREPHAGPQSPTEHHGNGDCKRQETEAPSNQTASASHLDLNFPLPGEKGPSCLVKVYEDWESFKLNDFLEVYGILSVDPALSALADEKDTSSSIQDPTECMETAEEQRVHSPPASLVPRLHMLYARPLPHNNPLLPCTTVEDNSAFLSSSLSGMASVRAELLAYLTHILLGDALAAEYLILHLISNVYTRRDVLPLGKFTLNLSGCPTVASYTERFYQIIQQLVPSSYYLGMSLQNMNQMRLVPKKDYVANRLVSGALQLARNTSLFLDETQLEQGQLDTTDCQIHLQSQVTAPQLEEYLSSIHMHPQASSQLNKFRIYLCMARQLDYNISDEMTKSVEEDFVDMRKDDPQSVSAEDLHRMLVVARLLSLSLGQTSLSRDSWLRAKHIDMLRRSRMEQHKCVNGNEP